MNAWAETVTHRRDEPGSPQAAREGDPCCAPDCQHTLAADEVAYSPTELDRQHANPGRAEPWVCWRHVRPDLGPITVDDEPPAPAEPHQCDEPYDMGGGYLFEVGLDTCNGANEWFATLPCECETWLIVCNTNSERALTDFDQFISEARAARAKLAELIAQRRALPAPD